MYKLRTIDVWDTLLRRDCHPECIKLATANHLRLNWCGELREGHRHHWEVYRLRLDAEFWFAEQSRGAGKDDEYTIDAVMARWLEACLGRAARQDEVARLVEFEINVEIARSFPDADIVCYLEGHPAERTLFLSDFYMGAHQLKRLLDHHGLSELVPDGISSCDVGFNKRSGRLFRHVHELYGVAPSEHFHVGDNRYSDVETPAGLGVLTQHYLPDAAHQRRCGYEALFASRNALFQQIEGEAAALASEQDGPSTDGVSLGVRVAPLFVGFCLYIAEQAIAGKVEGVHFLSREGEFYYQLFKRLFSDGLHAGVVLPPVGVLEVSRRSTFAASMSSVSIDEFSRAWQLHGAQNVAGIFQLLALDVEKFSDLLGELGLSVAEVVTDPSSDLRLQRLFSHPDFVCDANLAICESRGMLSAYLKQQGVTSARRVALVDIGWRGTIQDNIALIADGTWFDGLYLAFRAPVNEQPGNVTKGAYVVDQRVDGDWHRYAGAFAAMEMLCSAQAGTVVGYRRGPAGIEAVRDDSADAIMSTGAFVEDFQHGVLLAMDIWRPYVERYIISAQELREHGRFFWREILNSPPDALVQIFLNASHSDVFGGGTLCVVEDVPSLTTIVSAPFNRRARRELVQFVRRVQWLAAVNEIRSMGPVHRSALRAVFLAAGVVRHLKCLRGKWLRHFLAHDSKRRG